MELELGVNTACYDGYDLSIALENISKLGFKFVEIAAISGFTEHVIPEKMSPSDFKQVKKLMIKRNLSSKSFSGHFDLGQENAIEIFKRRIDFAEYIRANIVNTFTTDSKNYEVFRKNLDVLALYANKKGIRIGLETDAGLIYTGSEGAALLEKLNGYPIVGINYDPGNVIFFKPDVLPEKDVEFVGGNLIHVHLKDIAKRDHEWYFPGLGKGIINFPAFISKLVEMNFRGPMSLELELNMSGSRDFVVGPPRPLEEINQELRRSALYIQHIFQRC